MRAIFRYSYLVSLPAQIAVKYTEEEAEYLSVRPVRRQTFQLAELVDMILGVTGKDLPRIRQILRSGTIVFNFYRYWWQGFDADAQELAALLAKFPDADPARLFRADECTVVLLAGKGYQPPQSAPRHSESPPSAGRRNLSSAAAQAASIPIQFSLPANAVELHREELARKKLFSGKSFWDALMSLQKDVTRHSERSEESLRRSASPSPCYLGYSYLRRADVYLAEISPAQASSLARDAEKLAPRSVRALVPRISAATCILFLCPRSL